MALLQARNYYLIGNYTQIKTDVSASGTSIDVDSTQGFTANDWVVIGTPGEEGTEIKQVTAITDGDTLAITALAYAHTADAPIYVIPYNQIEFSRRSSSGGNSEVITTKTMQYEEGDYTLHDYPNASTSDYYVFRYRNSTTSNYSEYTSEFQIPTFYCTVDDVADYLGEDIRTDTDPLVYDQVAKVIRNITEQIDLETNSSFKSNTISTSTYEYIDGVGGVMTVEGVDLYRTQYWLDNKPVISVEELSVTSASDTTNSPTWTELTEDEDYYLDKKTGRFDIVTSTSFPPKGNKRIRVAYTYGRGTVPYDIRKLAVFMVIRDLAISGAGAKLIEKGDAYDRSQLQVLNPQIEMIINRYRQFSMNIT